jgi:hypothetical protein
MIANFLIIEPVLEIGEFSDYFEVRGIVVAIKVFNGGQQLSVEVGFGENHTLPRQTHHKTSTPKILRCPPHASRSDIARQTKQKKERSNGSQRQLSQYHNWS